MVKRIKRGEEIPFGLSRKESSGNDNYFLRIPTPIFWKIRQYDINEDAYLYGWKRFDLLLRFFGKTQFVSVGKQEEV